MDGRRKRIKSLRLLVFAFTIVFVWTGLEIVVNQFGFVVSSIGFVLCRYQIMWQGVKCLRKVHRYNSDNIVLIKFLHCSVKLRRVVSAP